MTKDLKDYENYYIHMIFATTILVLLISSIQILATVFNFEYNYTMILIMSIPVILFDIVMLTLIAKSKFKLTKIQSVLTFFIVTLLVGAAFYEKSNISGVVILSLVGINLVMQIKNSKNKN